MSSTRIVLVVLGLSLGTISRPAGAQDPHSSYDEPFRPQFHFSPAPHWMNDPNGLVYFDGGRTWMKYGKNPVIDIASPEFRDPKVSWHEPTRQWVMTVAKPDQRKVLFWGSPDLKNWTQLGEFGPQGQTSGIWECPDLFD